MADGVVRIAFTQGGSKPSRAVAVRWHGSKTASTVALGDAREKSLGTTAKVNPLPMPPNRANYMEEKITSCARLPDDLETSVTSRAVAANNHKHIIDSSITTKLPSITVLHPSASIIFLVCDPVTDLCLRHQVDHMLAAILTEGID